MKHLSKLALLSAVGLLVACNHNVSPVAPPMASSGYAKPGDDIRDPAVTFTRTSELQRVDRYGNISQQPVTVSISPTGNSNDVLFTYAGRKVIIELDSSGNFYSGVGNGLEVEIVPQVYALNNQSIMSLLYMNDHTGSLGEFWGFTVTGFNTDPDTVKKLTGKATYLGYGDIYITAQDESFIGHATGTATLVANFKTDKISGWMDLTNGPHGWGMFVNDTTLTINPMPIKGNKFDGTASVNPADLGLSKVGTISIDGMFYDAWGSTAGGYVSGTGKAAGTGIPAYINGAFLTGY